MPPRVFIVRRVDDVDVDDYGNGRARASRVPRLDVVVVVVTRETARASPRARASGHGPL